MDNPDTIRREYYSLERIKDNFPKYVVTMDEYRFQARAALFIFRLGIFVKSFIN